MGWFSGKRIGDPVGYTFQQVLSKAATAIEHAEANRGDSPSDLKIEITIRGAGMVETIDIPYESLQEVVAILRLNSDIDEAS